MTKTTTMTTAEAVASPAKDITIRIMRHRDPAIYRSHGGGQIVVVAEVPYSRGRLVQAWWRLKMERAADRRGYGDIGAGRMWIETSDGRTLDECGLNPASYSRSEFRDELEDSLRTADEQREWDESIDRAIARA